MMVFREALRDGKWMPYGKGRNDPSSEESKRDITARGAGAPTEVEIQSRSHTRIMADGWISDGNSVYSADGGTMLGRKMEDDQEVFIPCRETEQPYKRARGISKSKGKPLNVLEVERYLRERQPDVGGHRRRWVGRCVLNGMVVQ